MQKDGIEQIDMHHTECPYGGYNEQIDLTVEPWATLAPLCWNSPSPFRLGFVAEDRGVPQNPFKSEFARGLFEEGREQCREAKKFRSINGGQ